MWYGSAYLCLFTCYSNTAAVAAAVSSVRTGIWGDQSGCYGNHDYDDYHSRCEYSATDVFTHALFVLTWLEHYGHRLKQVVQHH